MSFILRFKALFITLSILLVVEVVLRLLPLRYIMGAGVFLTEHHRLLAESAEPAFDYVILGDSRSLSLMGHAPTVTEPYSIFNFSLPAMGPRYYKFFIEKYFLNRKHLPAAVIFAGDPALFMDTWNYAYHDKNFVYSESPDESLIRYLWNRFYRRIKGLLAGDRRYMPSGPDRDDPMLWDAFSHRYLHMFSAGELAQQMTGAERIFIVSQAVPLFSYLYKYREGIEQYTLGLRPELFQTVQKADYCASCAGVLRMECHPQIPRIQDNRLIELGLRQRYGQINLADRLKPELRLQFLTVRDANIAKHRERLESVRPALINARRLADAVTARGVKIVFVSVPMIEDYAGARYLKEYAEQMEALKKEYGGMMEFLHFPEPFYPKELFVEQVHYECPGSERLNADFYRDVVPQILRFAPYSSDPDREKVRGFPAGNLRDL
ncbi:MAG: hypothetical protein HS115_19675 [Spirochaetales bacterium]|nr:hypothetical protein [Spirochaetales bacterium]